MEIITKNRIRTALHACAVLVIIGLMHAAAMQLNLYYDHPYYDFILHFLGGVVVGQCAVLLVSRLNFLQHRSLFFQLVLIVIIMAVVGFAWEYMEYILGIANPGAQGYIRDTTEDFIADYIGVFVAYFFYIKKFTNSIAVSMTNKLNK